tara:strand:- start:463 stop:999 length:537 start_codon:yes stop_codon:yes gene_type:complete
MRFVFILLPIVIFVIANYLVTPSSEETLPELRPAQTASQIAKTYGAPVGKGKAITLKEVLQNPSSFAGEQVIVTGFVRKACSKKGCWMEMASSETSKGQGCRITFKDYGFFVPINSAGSTARLEGLVEIKKLEKAAVTHLESDGATFATKTQDGGAHEVRIVATGVELSRQEASAAAL